MFHKELYETVVAFPLKGTTYISFYIDNILIALKAKHTGKVINVKLRIILYKFSEDYIQTTCISSDHDQNISDVSKESI